MSATTVPTPTLTPIPVPPATAQEGFWQRRLTIPLRRLFTQGITPNRIAATLAVAIGCSLFPFIGATTALCLGVALVLRMNVPLMQTINYLGTPIHLAMILVYVRLGEWIWRDGSEPFSVTDMIATFTQVSLGEFIKKFGWIGIHAFTGWAVTVPFVVGGLYYGLRPVMKHLARAWSKRERRSPRPRPQPISNA